MSFTQPSHIIVTFDEYNVPDKKSVGSEFNGANIAKEIWFAFTDETLTNYTVVVNAKRADGDLGYRLCSKKTVDGVDYDYFALDSWFTEKVGKVILAVKVYKSSDITVNEDGTYTLLEDEPLIVVGDLFHLVVNYAPNADSLVEPFDPSDMQVIMAAIGNKASKSEVPLIVTALPSDLDTLIDGVYKYDGWFFMLTDGTLYRIDDDTATFIGKIGESVKYVKSREILAKGNVVQLDTTTGGFVKVKKAVPSEINVRPQLVLGLAMQAFTANGFGLILMQGYLSGINTSGASADGDLVYFDSGSASNGLFTMIRPTPPNAIVILGTVSNDAVNGSIDVRISTMPMSYQVNHDVTPTNYSSATQTVKDNLKGIDTAIGALNTFKDTTVPSTYISLSQKGTINGVATLGADGKVPDAQMPNITITDTNVVNSQALMLALTAQVGDVCVRTDLNKSYILKTAPATVLGNWQELLTPTDSVLSVAGKTGAVTLAKADVGLGNVDNTSDANKPVSTATQTALDLKADLTYVNAQLGLLETIPYEYGVREVVGQSSSDYERVLKRGSTYLFGANTGLTAAVAIDGAVATNSFDGVSIFVRTKVDIVEGGVSNTFVKVKKYYIKEEWTTENATDYHYIYMCQQKLSGYRTPLPFIKSDGTEREYAYIGAYEAYLDTNSKLRSLSGQFPKNTYSRANFRTAARALDGLGASSKYQITDLAEYVDLVQIPFQIEFATKHSQGIMSGVTSMPYSATHTATADGTAVNAIVVTNANGALFVIGQTIGIGTALGTASVATNRIITNIQADTPSAGSTTITFDGTAVNIAIGNIVFSLPWKSGVSDSVLVSGSKTANNGKYPIVWRGIENPYGNIWKNIDGVKISNYVAYVTALPSNYNDTASVAGVYAEPYYALGYTNASTDHYAQSLGYDATYPWAKLPNAVQASSSLYYRDYYYRNTGDRMAFVGGSWYNSGNAGTFSWHLNAGLGIADIFFGARLSYRP